MCSLTFIASWGVWSDGWLLIFRSLVLCYESTGHGETANSIWVLELEPELAGVVVDLLNLVQREPNEALVYDTSASYIHIIPLSFLDLTTTNEDLVGGTSLRWSLVLVRGLGKLLCCSYRILLSASECVVAGAGETYTTESIQKGVAAATLRRFGCVSSNMLRPGVVSLSLQLNGKGSVLRLIAAEQV